MVQEVKVKASDSVQEGQVLILGDSSVLSHELKAAEARLRGAEARLKEARDVSLPAAVKAAEAEVAAAKVERDRARSELDTLREVYHIGGADDEEFKAAKDRYETAEARLSHARALLERSLQEAGGVTLERLRSDIEALSSDLEAIRAEAQKRVVTAPASATVSEVYVKEGIFTTLGSPLLSLEWGGFKVECEMLAEDVGLVQAGVSAEISGDCVEEPSIQGTVSRVHSTAREVVSELGTKQRRVTVEITPHDQAGLRSGFPVDVRLIADRVDALAVPKNAVFNLDGAFHVFVVSDGRARLRKIDIGIRGDDFYEVVSGLDEGDLAIVSPPAELDDGDACVF